MFHLELQCTYLFIYCLLSFMPLFCLYSMYATQSLNYLPRLLSTQDLLNANPCAGIFRVIFLLCAARTFNVRSPTFVDCTFVFLTHNASELFMVIISRMLNKAFSSIPQKHPLMPRGNLMHDCQVVLLAFFPFYYSGRCCDEHDKVRVSDT